MVNTTGTKKRVAMVANSRPPITARPSGAFCSPPSPIPIAMGTMPIIIASAVMNTGLNRVEPASSAAQGIFGFGETLIRKTDDEDAVRRRDTHAHNGPHQRGYAQRCTRQIQHPADARQGRRQSSDDNERLAPRLEIDDDQKVDQHDREGQTAAQSYKRRLHGGDLAASHHAASFRQLFLRRGRDCRDVCSYSAQGATLCARVNVDRPLNVIVADHSGVLTATHSSQVFQELRLRHEGGIDRNGPKSVDRINLVLRSLRRNGVTDAIRREPEVRTRLEART